MTDISLWNWIVNTKDMTCRNEENQVIIKMEQVGENLKAKLHDMPMELFAEISRLKNGEELIEEIVTAAEKKYLSSQTQTQMSADTSV